jgi:hypothetical protein
MVQGAGVSYEVSVVKESGFGPRGVSAAAVLRFSVAIWHRQPWDRHVAGSVMYVTT